MGSASIESGEPIPTVVPHATATYWSKLKICHVSVLLHESSLACMYWLTSPSHVIPSSTWKFRSLMRCHVRRTTATTQKMPSRMVMIKIVSAKPVGRRELGPVEEIGFEAMTCVNRERNVLG